MRHQPLKQLGMLLRGKTNFFVCSYRHCSLLMFSISDIKRGNKIKIQELYHKSLVKIKEITELKDIERIL